MKDIVISADENRKVYSVPNVVVNNLSKYCIGFIKWLQNSPNAKRYRISGELCYDEDDFIEYLNVQVFPDQKSIFVENFGWVDFGSKLPTPYTDCPEFNF